MSEGNGSQRTKRRWWSRAELADHWQCSIRTLARMEAAGKLRATHISERIKRYSDEAVEAAERGEAA